MPFPRTLSALTALGVTALLLTSCAGGGEPLPQASGDAGAPTTAPAQTQPSATPTPTATADAVTCESLIGRDLLGELTSQNWTAKEAPFAAGGVTLSEGLQCTWADYAIASGNLMIFGWAPITADEATKMQRGLEAQGWLREDDGTALYITEDPNQAPTIDANGYGMTYQFGDGWVTVADLKQNLLLIQRPGQ